MATAPPGTTFENRVAPAGAGWLGVELWNGPDGRRSGAMVVQVMPGSPAAMANVQPGDVILTLQGQFVEDAKAVVDIIRRLPPGSQLALELLRYGQRLPLTVTLQTRSQVPHAQTSAPQMEAVPHAPTGASLPPPPAGYYQCYRLTVVISANSCKFGDLQLDGQGNYSSTSGTGGTYVFDPAAGVVSFSGGMLNGQMVRAKIARANTYLLVMREGGGLPSPHQINN